MDSGWIAVVVSILAIFGAFLIYRLQRTRKVLAYQIVSNTIVLSVKEGKDVQGRVEVLFDKKPVKDVHVVTLRLWNSGNTPIRREDYDRNNLIQIEFGKDAQVLEAEVLKTSHKNIENEVKSSLTISGENIFINPVLLNSQSSIYLKVLLTKFQGEITMDKMGIVGGQTLSWDKSFIGRALKSPISLFAIVIVSFPFSLFLSFLLNFLIDYFVVKPFIDPKSSLFALLYKSLPPFCWMLSILLILLILMRSRLMKELWRNTQAFYSREY